jgi:hypothetical protein
MRSSRARFLSTAFLFLVVHGCSSGSNPNGDVNVESVSNVSDTFNALEGLLFDESESSKFNARTQAEPGNFSYLGCHYKQDRDQMFQTVDRVRDPLCHIAQAETANVGFVIGAEDYTYYKITMGDEDPKPFSIRIGKFTNSDSRRCLRFQTCRADTQAESFEICETNDGINANVQENHADDFGSGQGSLDLTVHVDADGEPTAAEISHQFDGSWGAGSGQGSAEFTADKTTMSNTFLGRFDNSFDGQDGTFVNNAGVCVYAGGGIGSGKFQGHSEFPAFTPDDVNYYCPPEPGTTDTPTQYGSPTTCTQDFGPVTESFDMDFSVEPPTYVVVDNGVSPWFDLTDSCDIPDAPDAPDSFSEEWDCSAPDGFTELDAASLDFSECEKFQDHGGTDRGSCDEQHSDKSKEELPPPT